MDGLRDTALAHYRNGSKSIRSLAKKFYNAMDWDGDGEVTFEEFSWFMEEEGHSGLASEEFFEWLDIDDKGILDFEDVLTLYYIVKSGRPFCTNCGLFIDETYYTCVECFESPRREYYLCYDCYYNKRWEHDIHEGGCQILDNFTLLEAKRAAAVNQKMSNATVAASRSNRDYDYERNESRRNSRKSGRRSGRHYDSERNESRRNRDYAYERTKSRGRSQSRGSSRISGGRSDSRRNDSRGSSRRSGSRSDSKRNKSRNSSRRRSSHYDSKRNESRGSSTSRSLVLVGHGSNNKTHWKNAYTAFDTALNIVNMGTAAAAFCTIL